MEKEVIDIEEMRLLLVNNMFEEVSADNEDRLENFYTPFQIHLRLKVPVDNREYKMALQMLGMFGYYKGHSIPTNPDSGAFYIKENPDGEKYIQTLIPKSKLDEVESFIEEDENFNQYMRSECEKDAKALFEETNFICFGIMTSSPSEHFGHLLTYAATEITQAISTPRKAHIFIDHKLTETEILDYITPYKEGVKSSYERTGLALPGMPECHNVNDFTSDVEALRMYYKICNKKNIVVDNPIPIKNFLGKLIEKKQIPPENNINEIAKNYISLRRVSKYLFDEYYSLYDLGLKLKYSKFKQIGAIGEAEILNDVVLLLRKHKDKLLKEKEEREY